MGDWQAFALCATVAVAYLALLRLVDMNEREPIWALGLVLTCGFITGSQLRVIAGSPLLDLTIWPAIAAREAALLVALLMGYGALAAVARWRGWSDITDATDGLVYGAAAGLGTSVGELFVRELGDLGLVAQLTLPPTPMLAVASALGGLALGVAGGVTGAAFVVARDAPTRARRIAWFVGGLAVAVGVHAVMDWLAHGDALGGDWGYLRPWAALLLPCLAVLAAGVYAVRVERAVIARNARGEIAAGIASAGDVELLGHPLRRTRSYLRTLMHGGIRDCWLQMSLHNRLVQLALIHRRAARAPSRHLDRQVAALRESIGRLREELTREGGRL